MPLNAVKALSNIPVIYLVQHGADPDRLPNNDNRKLRQILGSESVTGIPLKIKELMDMTQGDCSTTEVCIHWS